MNTIKDDPSRHLLESALQAASQVRREWSLSSLLRRWWRRRAERLAEKQCQRGSHHFTRWELIRESTVWEPQAVKPLGMRYTYRSTCAHCGEPFLKKLDSWNP